MPPVIVRFFNINRRAETIARPIFHRSADILVGEFKKIPLLQDCEPPAVSRSST